MSEIAKCSQPQLHEQGCACGYLYEIERLRQDLADAHDIIRQDVATQEALRMRGLLQLALNVWHNYRIQDTDLERGIEDDIRRALTV